MAIPPFSASGVLPPFIGATAADRNKRSPYVTDMFELVERFCTSEHRAKLLLGLNSYRKHLSEEGFSTGTQWIDGSFVEDVENIRKRPPSDIDMVTLFYRPIKYQIDPGSWGDDYKHLLHEKYFCPRKMKKIYFCDTYPIDLDEGMEEILGHVMYWSGIFTDIKNSREKKGIVQIPLPSDTMEFAAIDSAIRGKFDV